MPLCQNDGFDLFLIAKAVLDPVRVYAEYARVRWI